MNKIALLGSDEFYEGESRFRQVYELEQNLRPTFMERAENATINLIQSSAKPVAIMLGLLAVTGAIVAITPRGPGMRDVYEQLSSRPAIACTQDNDCAGLEKMLTGNKDIIEQVAEETDVEADELRALLAASYLNPHRAEKQKQGYCGAILLKPEQVGIPGAMLDSDFAQNIYTAATIYKRMQERARAPEVGVAYFLGDEEAVDNALSKGYSEWSRCHGTNGKGACNTLEEYRENERILNRMRDAVKDEKDPEKRKIIQEQLESEIKAQEDGWRGKIHEEDLPWFENFERQGRWTTHVDDYTREGVNIFYSYINNK